MKENKDTSLANALFTAGDAVIGTAVLAVIGVYAGRFLDERLGTSPWLTVVLSLLGVIAGLARMVIKSIKADKNVE